MRAFLIGCFLLVGCVQKTPIMAPDGGQAVLIECGGDRKRCLEAAADECPRGYRILDQESRTGVFTTPGQAGYGPQVWNTYKGQMMVRCGRAEAQ